MQITCRVALYVDTSITNFMQVNSLDEEDKTVFISLDELKIKECLEMFDGQLVGAPTLSESEPNDEFDYADREPESLEEDQKAEIVDEGGEQRDYRSYLVAEFPDDAAEYVVELEKDGGDDEQDEIAREAIDVQHDYAAQGPPDVAKKALVIVIAGLRRR